MMCPKSFVLDIMNVVYCRGPKIFLVWLYVNLVLNDGPIIMGITEQWWHWIKNFSTLKPNECLWHMVLGENVIFLIPQEIEVEITRDKPGKVLNFSYNKLKYFIVNLNVYMYLFSLSFFLLSNFIAELLAHLVQQIVNEVKLIGLIPFWLWWPWTAPLNLANRSCWVTP